MGSGVEDESGRGYRGVSAHGNHRLGQPGWAAPGGTWALVTPPAGPSAPRSMRPAPQRPGSDSKRQSSLDERS